MLNGLEFYFPIVFPLLRGSAPSPLERIQAAPGKLVRSAFYAGVWLLALVAVLRPPTGRGRELAWVMLGVAAFALPYFPFLTFGAHSSYNLGTVPCLSIAAAVGLHRVAAAVRKALRP